MSIFNGPIRKVRRALRSIPGGIRRARLRFGAEGQRVTAAVMTKRGGDRLPRLLSQLRQFADEIIVGVDASSPGRTAKVARKWADRVYGFRLSGETGPARDLVFSYATGDWILSIDDDELVEDNFGEIVRDLIGNPAITHAWFPRKWIVRLEPCEFAFAPMWYPDWQRRLFRNDTTLAYKPSGIHTGYWVSGPGVFEARASILHLEPVVLGPVARKRKLERYKAQGSTAGQDSQFSIPSDVATRPAVMPKIEVRPPFGRGSVNKTIHALPEKTTPGWGVEILSIDTASHARPGEQVNATVQARNCGSLAWMPHAGYFPRVSLGYYLRNEHGDELPRNNRFPVRQPVRPGATVDFLITYPAPEAPGRYVLEWDMVSDRECWFRDLGGKTITSTLVVGDRSAAKDLQKP